MKFGKVDNPLLVDFKLPPITDKTFEVLNKYSDNNNDFEAFVGGAKWSKLELKGLFPPKTKDELTYYSRQFNSIEMNGTFYRSPTKEQVITWKNKAPKDFKFFPKIPQSISHYGRLFNVREKLTDFLDAITLFEEQLGMTFLQLHDNFSPNEFHRLKEFIESFPKGYPLAVEVRNEKWFDNKAIFDEYSELLEINHITNIIVDTPGRRDMLHMQLTSPNLFVRFVSAYHPLDYDRLDEWIEKIKELKEAGLKNVYFFIHQSLSGKEELYATYFTEKLNKELGLNIRVPRLYEENLLF